MRFSIASIGFFFALVITTCPTQALDCTNKPSETDNLLCGSQELESAYRRMWGFIRPLANFFDERDFAEIVAEQEKWIDQWARSCDPKTSPAGTVVCLRPAMEKRLVTLWDRYNEVTAGRQGDPFDVGGLPLTMKERGPWCLDIVIGDTVVAECRYRIDPLARYRRADVDAFAFIANAGGNGIHCEPFELYVVAVRPGRRPEIVHVPKEIDSPVKRGSCFEPVVRDEDGFQFEIKPTPWASGRVYRWTPTAGLTLVSTPTFAPRAGTTMKDLLKDEHAGGKLENEQFYNALLAATRAASIDFATAAEAFSWTWTQPFEIDNYVALNSCPFPGRGERCFGDLRPKAVYDRLTDKLYFVFPNGPPTCLIVGGEDLRAQSLRTARYYPPRWRWPEGAFLAMKEIYCEPN